MLCEAVVVVEAVFDKLALMEYVCGFRGDRSKLAVRIITDDGVAVKVG